ncbi:sugar transferase, partial [Candidatus Izimaplasma bacterium]|nr:sugar transferase [Candidatus Izimaplasma bacterium]
VFIILVVLIKLDSKGPVIFTQKRIGKHKKHFDIYKFRTMRIDTPENTPTHLLENPNQWITRMGRLMRKTSLDELPQFFNILKGDMSFVGPRPALWNQYDLIEEREKYKVHNILPGVTGNAQVSGRDQLLIIDKAKLDGEYLEQMSLLTDIKLVLKTISIVLKSEGVVEGGTGTTDNKTNRIRSKK